MRSIGAHMMLADTPPVLPLSAAPEVWPFAAPVMRTVPALGTAGASVRSVSRSRPAPNETPGVAAAKTRMSKGMVKLDITVPTFYSTDFLGLGLARSRDAGRIQRDP